MGIVLDLQRSETNRVVGSEDHVLLVSKEIVDVRYKRKLSHR